MIIPAVEKYKKEAIPTFKKEFGLKNDLQVPKMTKITINCGFGKLATSNPNGANNLEERVVKTLTLITGQKPALRGARQSISGFKLREGQPVAYVVTLRGQRMYDFYDRLINIALPRSRDFWGINESKFDNRGNLNIGLKEHTIFPETAEDISGAPFGLEVNITINSKNKEQGVRLMELMGMPLVSKTGNKKQTK
jgi:large subunit ribosomal protein L5